MYIHWTACQLSRLRVRQSGQAVRLSGVSAPPHKGRATGSEHPARDSDPEPQARHGHHVRAAVRALTASLQALASRVGTRHGNRVGHPVIEIGPGNTIPPRVPPGVSGGNCVRDFSAISKRIRQLEVDAPFF